MEVGEPAGRPVVAQAAVHFDAYQDPQERAQAGPEAEVSVARELVALQFGHRP